MQVNRFLSSESQERERRQKEKDRKRGKRKDKTHNGEWSTKTTNRTQRKKTCKERQAKEEQTLKYVRITIEDYLV